jgi:hypothetical protein
MRLPLGLKLLIGFFWFGAAMCALTLLALAFPDGILAFVWRLKPEARTDFALIGNYAFLLMAAVGLACAFAAIGLARRARWGHLLAIAVLSVNLLGDLLTTLIRHDYRTLIGLPIGAALIIYLLRTRPAG